MKCHICLFALLAMLMYSTSSLTAQDHAVDVGYMYQRFEPLGFGFDDGADLKLTIQGPTVGYTGYIGLFNASEIRIGYVSGELEVSSSRTSASTDVDTDGWHISYSNKFYIDEEVSGFNYGFGVEFNILKEAYTLGSNIQIGYRFMISDRLGIEPSAIGGFGFFGGRGDFGFDGDAFVSYGGIARFGYNF